MSDSKWWQSSRFCSICLLIIDCNLLWFLCNLLHSFVIFLYLKFHCCRSLQKKWCLPFEGKRKILNLSPMPNYSKSTKWDTFNQARTNKYIVRVRWECKTKRKRQEKTTQYEITVINSDNIRTKYLMRLCAAASKCIFFTPLVTDLLNNRLFVICVSFDLNVDAVIQIVYRTS